MHENCEVRSVHVKFTTITLYARSHSLPVAQVAGSLSHSVPKNETCAEGVWFLLGQLRWAAYGCSMEQERALVVHPLFVHTLPKDVPRPPQRWDSLPSAILYKFASVMTTAQDLVTFEVLNRSCW